MGETRKINKSVSTHNDKILNEVKNSNGDTVKNVF
jgi:hypothetical protein